MHASLTWGTSLVLLVDDFVNDYEKKNWKQLYDPDISHLINSQWLSPIVWKPKDLASRETAIQLGLIGNNPDEEEKQRDWENLDKTNLEKFQFILWSKEKYSEQLTDAELLAKLKKRFEKSLPLKHLNLLFLETSVSNEW